MCAVELQHDAGWGLGWLSGRLGHQGCEVHVAEWGSPRPNAPLGPKVATFVQSSLYIQCMGVL